LIIFEKKVDGLNPESLRRFLLSARRAARLGGAVNLLLTSSHAMRRLNLIFRKKDKPTDVLSFPSLQSIHTRKTQAFAGEIAISVDIAAQNANKLGHSQATEVKILALHGILHLAGYDHERDNGTMARKEADLRRRLRLPSSLTERGEVSMRRHEKPRGRTG